MVFGVLSASSGIIIAMTKHIVIDARIRRASTGRPIDRLVEYLQDIDHTNHYTILVQPDDDWQMHSPTFHTLPCPYPQFSLSPLHQVGFAWQLYRLKPDLVHFTMTQQPLLYFGNIVTMTHDTTMYHFIRQGTTPLPLFKLKMGLYRFLVWWSHRKSRRIIVPTRTVAEEFITRQPFTKKKMVVINEAAEPAGAFKPRRPEVVGPHDRFIMYLGTAFPHKNLPMLVKAFELLHHKYPDLKLLLVGKREKHYDDLAKLVAKSPVAAGIHITGFLPDDETAWLYAHTRAYVFVSLSEGWGLPPLEAMAHGAPVVCSDASVMPEVYGAAAHYCNAQDPQDIAAKVMEVLENPALRQKLISSGTEQLKKYSWHKWAEEHVDVYADLLTPPAHTKEPDFE
jgi:glycosyltransferase involved in cell wall biosynthesis